MKKRLSILFVLVVMLAVGFPVLGVTYQEAGRFDANGLMLPLDTNKPIGLAADATVVKSDGTLRYYRASANTGAARYTTLTTALAEATAGDKVILSAGAVANTATITVPAGVKLQGAGKSQTVITRASGTQGVQMSGTGDNIEISDLTIDVNGSGLAASSSGVVIRGNNATIRNVRATRAIGTTTEAFVLTVFASATSITGALIEGCEVDNFSGSNGTMIMLGLDANNPAATASGIVQNNSVHDCPTAQAYGSAGTLNAVFRNNYSYNCRVGFYRDTFLATNHQVVNNQFMYCKQYGILLWATPGAFGNHPAVGDVVVGNTVEMIPYPIYGLDQISYWIHASGGGTLTDLVLANNTALNYGPDTVNAAIAQRAYQINITSNLIARDNVSSPVLWSNFTVASGTPVITNNVNTDGTPLYANDASLTRTRVTNNVVTTDLATNTTAGLLAASFQTFTGQMQLSGSAFYLDTAAKYVRHVQSTNDGGTYLDFTGGATAQTRRGILGFGHTGSGSDTIFTGETADSMGLLATNDLFLGGGGNHINLKLNASGNTIYGNVATTGNIQAGGTGSVTGYTISAETTVAGDGSLLTNLDARRVSANARDVADTDTTLTTDDYIVRYTTLTAARVVTLPSAASANGVFFIIKDRAGTATANPITFAAAVEGSTAAISTNYGVVRVQSDGTVWYRL